MGKKPRKAFDIAGLQKVPRGGQVIADISAKNFCWRFSDLDMGGPFGWQNVDPLELMQVIIPKLHDYESMTWAEMDGPSGSHSIDKGDLCREAQDRLDEIGMSDVEALFSVRITGARRVWGVKNIAILRVLWWDPEHQVCPSKLKNT